MKKDPATSSFCSSSFKIARATRQQQQHTRSLACVQTTKTTSHQSSTMLSRCLLRVARQATVVRAPLRIPTVASFSTQELVLGKGRAKTSTGLVSSSLCVVQCAATSTVSTVLLARYDCRLLSCLKSDLFLFVLYLLYSRLVWMSITKLFRI